MKHTHLITFAVVLALALQAAAAYYQWAGAGADILWSTPANWTGDYVAVSAADTEIHMAGTLNKINTNDVASPFILNKLYFSGNATTIGGAPLRFAGDDAFVYKGAGVNCVMENLVELSAPLISSNAVGGNSIRFSGGINDNGHTLSCVNTGSGRDTYLGGECNRSGTTVVFGVSGGGFVRLTSMTAPGSGPVALESGARLFLGMTCVVQRVLVNADAEIQANFNGFGAGSFGYVGNSASAVSGAGNLLLSFGHRMPLLFAYDNSSTFSGNVQIGNGSGQNRNNNTRVVTASGGLGSGVITLTNFGNVQISADGETLANDWVWAANIQSSDAQGLWGIRGGTVTYAGNFSMLDNNATGTLTITGFDGTQYRQSLVRLSGTGTLACPISLSRAIFVGAHNSQGVLVLANTSGTQTFSGVISQGFAGTETFTGYTNVLIREAAGGVSILSGANTYTGGTVVAGGTLLVNNTSGSGCGTGPVFVPGGVFGGNGSVDGIVNVGPGGSLAPGMSIGTLTINNALDLSGGAVIHWEKNDTSADKIVCNSVALGSDVTVMVHRLTGAIGMTETDTVFQCTSPPTDVPALDFTYGGGWTSGTIFIDGNDIKITGLVPEPALGVGLLIAVSFMRRRAHVVR